MDQRKFITALYGRTSKDDPKRVTIEIQQQRLRDWSARDPLVESVFAEYWDDGVTGKLPLWERPAGKQLLEAVKAGRVQSVAVLYADRFGRTLLDGLQAVKTLGDHGVKLVAVNDGWDSRRDDNPLFFQFRMMMAEEEHRRIAERMQNGKLRAMERDNAPPGGPLVFGYRMDEHGRFVPDPVEAPIVVHIFEMALQGYSNSVILAWVKTTGVPAGRKWQKRAPGSAPTLARTDESSQWHLTKIGKILRNRTYIGERRWGDRRFQCEPLVDEATFERVQPLNQRRTAARGTYRNADHGLLSGLLVCASCGARYYHRPHAYRRQDGSAVRYPIYMCNNARKHWGVCKAKTLRVDELDADVWARIENYIENPEALVKEVIAADHHLSEQVAVLDAEEQSLSAELEGIDREAAHVWEQQKANSWPIGFVTPKLNDLNARRDRVTTALEDLRRKKSAAIFSMDLSEAVTAALTSIRTKLKTGLTAKEKSAIVRLLVPGGIVTTVGTGQEKRAEVSVDIKWVTAIEGSAPDPCPQVPND
jgi:site-specific DNA recombinase